MAALSTDKGATTMARRGSKNPPPPEDYTERIVDVDVADEMRGSYLEYAYSVIYARALPDARDGLKPVQRRILYRMAEDNLGPTRGHVKSARVVGDVMGRLHPHGDGAIYDALVRMAQPFSLRVPLIDGHGNFGNLDDGPAAMRYTECRLTAAATLLTDSLDEDVVDFRPNYDDREQEPGVLPAAFPNLLVNGASGIAVGMATNMAPHNLGEVIAAARHLLVHPDATLDDLMAFVPGPDFPSGGRIVGLDGIREAYESGRGSMRVRATARIENVSPRRRGIVVTELPYGVGPERVVEKIADLAKAKKVQGIADVVDLTDGESGLHLVIEVKNGFHPEAILETLYRLTPLEDSFAINNVALVEGAPRTLGLRELLNVYVDHRISVVRRRSEYRLRKARDRAHIVEGLLIALDAIDDIIEVIRRSADATEARQRLMDAFELSEIQAQHILDMSLRRLTALEVTKLRDEMAALTTTIDELTSLLADEGRLRGLVSDELAAVATAHSNPRRTILLESSGAVSRVAMSAEVADEPCRVLLSSTGLLARTSNDEPLGADGPRARHDVVVSQVTTTARSEIAVVTSSGRAIRVNVVDIPALPPTAHAPSLAGGVPASELVVTNSNETSVALMSPDDSAATLLLGTASGVVKRVAADAPANKKDWDLINLREGDRVVGAIQVPNSARDLRIVLVSDDGQLLHFPSDAVRAQGRAAGGVAGINLSAGARVLYFGVVASGAPAAVVTVSGSSDALPGTQAGSIKCSDFAEFPGKGRATAGVRCHRFLKGEDVLLLAWAGATPARGATASGVAIDLPPADAKRDASGSPLPQPLAAVGTNEPSA
jgi:DNA gyrase subunit A